MTKLAKFLLVNYLCTVRSNQALAFHIDELLSRVKISLQILVFFLEVRLECSFEILRQNFLVELKGMLDFSDILKVACIWNPKAFHAVGVTPLLEVLFESAASPVACSTANLAFKLLPQAVQFVEPVGNGLSIPAHWQTFWVVLRIVFVVRTGATNCCSLC